MTEIIRATGTTASERYLTALAERTFLRLWSYPNLFIDKRQNAKGTGKELCDLLVVFGDDVLIFSDKKVTWPTVDDVAIAWPRWFRKAVGKSAEQIKGAERWLESFSDRVFLDDKCSKRLPLTLPKSGQRRTHGIVVANGATAACKKYFSGGHGTLMVAPFLKEGDHSNSASANFRPFTVGDINPEGSFIHVFDEQALNFIMGELDTVSDFTRYLNKRENFVRSGKLLAAPGEEDLLGYYLQTEDINQEHDFVDPTGKPISAETKVVIEEGQFLHLLKRPEYLRKRAADKISFTWDKLIEIFTQHVLAGTSISVFGETPDIISAERALRIMAAENRVTRRALSESFVDALREAERRGTDRFARVVLPKSHFADQATAYIFLILGYPKTIKLDGGYEQYRKVRANLLHAYCLGVLEKNRHLKRAIGIGIDASPKVTGRAGGSEDLIAFEVDTWTKELVNQANELKATFDILDPKRQKLGGFSTTEYPPDPSASAPMSRQQRRALERAARKKKK